MGTATTVLLFGAEATATQVIIGNIVYVGISMAVTSALAPKPNIPDTKNNLGTTIDSISMQILYMVKLEKAALRHITNYR